MKNNENLNVQVGYIVRITSKPSKSKKRGFTVGSEHKIQKPPKGYLNTLMAVWLKASNGNKFAISFPYFIATGKKA